jgi:hypothetical protein
MCSSQALAEDTVLIEPVSFVKFPANRKKLQGILPIQAVRCNFGAQSASEFNGFHCIPYATEQRISEHVSGKILRGTGNFHAEFLISNF